MVHTTHSKLLMVALLLAVAPLAYARDGVEDDGSIETEVHKSSSGNSGEFKNSTRFAEMLAQFKAKIEKEHGTSTRSKMEDGKRASSTRAKWEKGSRISSVDATCVQQAVDVREVAIQSAFNKSNASIIDALKARQTALYAGWGQAEVSARNTALKDAWKAWKDARTSTGKTLKSERDSAWKTFKTTVKDTCKVSVPKEDESAGSDSSGQTAL
jgi:hypothetical protein